MSRSPAPGSQLRKEESKDRIVTSAEFPASTTLPHVPAFTELTIEDTVEEGLQAISHKALHKVMRDHYEHLKTTEFRLLP